MTEFGSKGDDALPACELLARMFGKIESFVIFPEYNRGAILSNKRRIERECFLQVHTLANRFTRIEYNRDARL